MSSSNRAPSIQISRPQPIPRAREASPPPPLIPPEYMPGISTGHDLGWQWANHPSDAQFDRHAAVKPGSSLLGGATNMGRGSWEKETSHDPAWCAHRTSSISTVTMARHHDSAGRGDDGNSPGPSPKYRHDRPHRDRQLGSERQLERRTLTESSQSYDKQLLSRIGGPNAPKRQSISHTNAHEVAQVEAERRNNGRPLLSTPEQRPDSPHIGPSAAAHGPPDSRAANSLVGGALDDAAPHGPSYDHSMFVYEDLMDDASMSTLNLHDRSPSGSDHVHAGGSRVGSKRRAASPPPGDETREDRPSASSASGHGESYQRRSAQLLPNKDSPVGRVHHPHHSSVSSVSSLGPRHGSLGSSLGVASIPSSATSYGSGRLSPSMHSPAASADPATLDESAQPDPSAPSHQRAISESTQMGHPAVYNASHSRKNSMSHIYGVYMCECCPKKPKKFDSAEGLRLHESEKQYTCAYCPNRFKNKNEAERHQNSLHLRRHSWSCAALTGVQAAFHASSSDTSADVCGYCGEVFTNPPQWDVRAEHLNHTHKFGECNQAKKFFRADHFRQHLKHSHAGTSGKWTNMLENACMKDEPLPEKRVDP